MADNKSIKNLFIESFAINSREGGQEFINALQALIAECSFSQEGESKDNIDARLRDKIKAQLENFEMQEAVRILVSVINEVTLPKGYSASVTLRDSVSVEGEVRM